IGKLFDAGAAQAAAGADKTGDAAAAAVPDAERLLALVQSILGEGGSGAGGGKGSPTEDKIKQLADSTVLLQDSVKRAQEELDRQFEDGA
uniref:hypothetical protein n=1 Tax=Salmonella enterica TaxID=28901 RepID=UPI00329A6B0D